MTNGLAERGWTEQATPLEGGDVRCEGCQQTTAAADLPVEAVLRVEGASDPDDMAAIVPFCCGHCGANDVLILKYGPEASGAEVDVLAALPTT